jgi:hypothetical protein
LVGGNSILDRKTALDHLVYIYNDRYNYVASFLYWSFFEKKKRNPKKVCQEKWDYTSGTEGVGNSTLCTGRIHGGMDG